MPQCGGGVCRSTGVTVSIGVLAHPLDCFFRLDCSTTKRVPMPKRAVWERSRRELDISVGVHILLVVEQSSLESQSNNCSKLRTCFGPPDRLSILPRKPLINLYYSIKWHITAHSSSYYNSNLRYISCSHLLNCTETAEARRIKLVILSCSCWLSLGGIKDCCCYKVCSY